MNKLDQALTRLHQWIVDLTQKEPQVLVRLCVKLLALTVVVRLALLFSTSTVALHAVSGTVVIFAAIRLAINPPLFQSRMILLLLAVVPVGFTATGLLVQIGSVLLVNMVYFKTCSKPKPPKKKQKLQAFSGAV